MVTWKKICDSSRIIKDGVKNGLSSIFQYHAPTMRIIAIEQDKVGDYIATVQFIGKSTAIKIKPEELLSDDKMVDQFSSRDIRALTYLGYLGINAPKYKVLARKLSEDSDQMLFAIHKKGDSKYTIKTAQEISSNPEILESLPQKDAHDIGFVTATEEQSVNQRQKENLLKESQNGTPPKKSDQS